MLIDLDESGEYDDERISDPVISRIAERLERLMEEIDDATRCYPLNRKQLDQALNSMEVIQYAMRSTETLEALDAMLRLTFPERFLVEDTNAIPTLLNFPLSMEN